MRSIMVILSLLVAACASSPGHETRPTVSIPDGEFVTWVQGVDPARELPDHWWRLYRDPVLDALVAQALSANTDLRVAAANLARARAIADEARGRRLPSTSIGAGASYGGTVQGGSGLGTDGGVGGVTPLGSNQLAAYAQSGISWEADLFGRISGGIAAAEADAEAALATRDAMRVLVVAETTRAYLNACSLASSVQVARQSLEASEKNLGLVRILEEAGALGRLEVERSAAAAAGARAAIPALEGERQASLFELAALLGQTSEGIPPDAQTCAVPPVPVADVPIGDVAALLRRRPDLREAERRLAADTARVGVATADLYPTISLSGFGNFFRSKEVRGGDSLSFSLGPLLSWNFPNRSAARARVRQASAQSDASLARFDGRVLDALKETEQALARLASGQRELAALEDAQASAERAWELAELRFRAGSASQLDVLVALNELLRLRATVAQSDRALGSTRIDLFKALGGGWQESEVRPDQ